MKELYVGTLLVKFRCKVPTLSLLMTFFCISEDPFKRLSKSIYSIEISEIGVLLSLGSQVWICIKHTLVKTIYLYCLIWLSLFPILDICCNLTCLVFSLLSDILSLACDWSWYQFMNVLVSRPLRCVTYSTFSTWPLLC